MQLTDKQIKDFQSLVLSYYHAHGRHALPWRTTHKTPYHILISEIMLQQTQVDRVIPKFLNFVTTFPTLHDLAVASQAKVLTHWNGLGYNRRARMLHQATQLIVNQHNGVVPQTIEELIKLPGIGPYAAASIPAFAYNLPTPVLDTNIRAIFIHHFFNEQSEKINDKELLSLVKATLDTSNPRHWYSALMDYGTYLKSLGINPIKQSKHYSKQSKFKGSNRELRGAIIRALTLKSPRSKEGLITQMSKIYITPTQIVVEILEALQKEQLIEIKNKVIKLL